MNLDNIDEQIENLKNDRIKVQNFVYTLMNEYNEISEELDNIESTIISQTSEQKKYLYNKQRFLQKKQELILTSISSLVKELTDIPEKIVDINIKMQEFELDNEEEIEGMVSREKLYG